MSTKLAELATEIGAELIGDGSRTITGCAGIEEAGETEVTFVANSKYSRFLDSTKAAAVVLHRSMPCPDHVNKLVADDPYFAFRNAMVKLHGFRHHSNNATTAVEQETTDVSQDARIHPTATVGEKCIIHPYAVVDAGATVGRGTVLYPGAFVGRDSVIGNDCILHSNVVIYDRCILGDRVTLHANTVIGQDGFGYATHKGEHHKIPQAGIVVVEDDVELGASCAIERATLGETRIGKGTKMADLISIGHGTTIGRHCLFVSLVGVSGSVDVGNYVVLGGQVGVAGHLRIGDQVQAAARTAIAQDVPDGLKVAGTPAIPLDQAKRNALAGTELYELFRRVKRLERELKDRQKK